MSGFSLPSWQAAEQELGLSPLTGLHFHVRALNLPETSLQVTSFQLHEQYQTCYHLTLQIVSPNAFLPADALLDQKLDFSIWQGEHCLRRVNGTVVAFSRGETGHAYTYYQVEVAPDLFRLKLRRNSRIYQQKNIQQILRQLCAEHGITHYAFALQHPHGVREYCVQWQESDYDFLQRLTAEEGIFYYVEQHEGYHTVVFSDESATLREHDTFTYNPNVTAQRDEKTIHRFQSQERLAPTAVVLQDYTFKQPAWQARFTQQAHDIQTQRTGYEHYDYPGRFKNSEQGKAFSRYRLESLRREAHTGEGESNIPQLSAGYVFTLRGHPVAANNQDWQVIALTMEGKQPQAVEGEAGEQGSYVQTHFRCIPRQQTWRPLQRTKPKVDGPQMAVVVGPAGEEIFTDQYGRVKLQFFWDREGQHDDHSSCWVRVSQAWAGEGWGMLAIPRVGQEVLVDFLDGDPDQPIVTGRTYHATNLPPGRLPSSKTQMALRSKSYKGEGYNQLLFEDMVNQERMALHAQRDMDVEVLHDKTTKVGNDHHEMIEGDQTLDVKKDRWIEINNNENNILHEYSFVGENQILLIEKDIHFSSNTEIILKTGQAYIKLLPNKIEIKGKDDVSLNAKETFWGE